MEAQLLRESGISADRAMLVAGPQPRNLKANHQTELMRLDV